MPPFESLPRTLRSLAEWAGPRRAGPPRTGPRRTGPGVGALLEIGVLSFGVVLAAATALAVVRGGPTPAAGPVDRQGVLPALPAAGGTAGAGEGPARTPGPRPGGAAGGDRPAAGRSATPPLDGGSGPDAAVPAIARASAELPGRLDDILRVREAAFARRDAGLLATIYTADCVCLRAGREAIARLRADRALWRGRTVSVRVERLSRVDDALWIAVAVLRRSAFRIEGEDGSLIAAEPPAVQRYRFALARTPAGAWLLGHASLIEELPP